MHKLTRVSTSRLLLAALIFLLAAFPASAQVSVRSVKVLGSKDAVEIEVESSDRIVPQAQVLTGPDRLVVDFPNAVPGNQVRSQSIDRGDVKDVRIGLFQSKPPVTRVVVDLKSAQSYQLFPSGRTVMIKVMGGAVASSPSIREADFNPQSARPGLVVANYTTRVEPVRVAVSRPTLQISYQNGMLSIRADKATLSEVLYAVQQRTGADISIPAGAEQERVVAEYEPAPAAEVLARLLNGSSFNFMILNSASDPRKIDRVILSARAAGNFVPPPVAMQNPVPPAEDGIDDAPAAPIPPNNTAAPVPPNPGAPQTPRAAPPNLPPDEPIPDEDP